MKDFDRLLKRAIEENEFQELLWGKGDYHVAHAMVEFPSDLTQFLLGLNNYRVKIGDQALTGFLTNELKLLLQTPVGAWWCLCIIYHYLFALKADTLEFRLDFPSLEGDINQSLAKFQSDLRGEKSWVGYRFENGLFDDVLFMVKKINAENINGFRLILD